MTTRDPSGPVWLPFAHLSTFKVKKERRIHTAWVAERAPFTLETAPSRSAVLILRGSGSEIVWASDGQSLYRDVRNTDGEPLTLADLEWEGLSARQLLLNGVSYTPLVDYPLTVLDPRNEAEAMVSAEWREAIESGAAKHSNWEFARWEHDGRVEGQAAAQAKLTNLMLDGDRLIRRADEPMIAVRSNHESPCVIVDVVIPPDLHGNHTTRSTLVDADRFEGEERSALLSPEIGAIVFFPIDQAETARRCAARIAEQKGPEARIIDVLPEIEIAPDWKPTANCDRAFLECFVTRLHLGAGFWGGNRHSQDGDKVSVQMARRALKMSAAGDDRLIPFVIDAFWDDARSGVYAIFKEFAALRGAAEAAALDGPDLDMRSLTL